MKAGWSHHPKRVVVVLGAIVAASIMVMDDDAEIAREWELDGEP